MVMKFFSRVYSLKWKLFSSNFEYLKESSSTIVYSSLSIVNLSIGIPIASSSTLVTSVALLITNEYISKLKMQFTKLRKITKLVECF